MLAIKLTRCVAGIGIKQAESNANVVFLELIVNNRIFLQFN